MKPVITVVVFFVVTLGMGQGLLALAGATLQRNPILRGIETLGFGLAAFSFAGVVFHVLHVPIDFRAYIAVACVGPVVALVRRRTTKAAGVAWTRDETTCALVLVALLLTFFGIYCFGALSYPYLEDTDPWLHAEGALYIAKERTYSVDPLLRHLGGFANYLEPYPPTFDVIMGVLRQTNDSVYWTLKVFNVVLVTLALGFSFLFGEAYAGSAPRGLFVTVVLAALPSFMSHFIWSQSLALCVFPVAMYGVLRAFDDRRWTAPAALSIASLMVTQPVVSLMGGVVLLLLVATMFLEELGEAETFALRLFPRSARGVLVGAAGLAGSFLYWGEQLAKWGISGIVGLKGDEFTDKWHDAYAMGHTTLLRSLFPSAKDTIDQPTGWGPVVVLALCAGVVACGHRLARALGGRATSFRDAHLLVWFFLLLYIVFAPRFDLPSWGSARAWAYLAIPVALLATEGVFVVARAAVALNPKLELAVVLLAALGIGATSAPVKMDLETAAWGVGGDWTFAGTTAVGLRGFVEMRRILPRNSRVYSLCGSDARSIAFDMDSSPWERDEAAFRERLGTASTDDVIAFLDRHAYAYFTFDATCWAEWGESHAVRFARETDENPRVHSVHTADGFVLSAIGAPTLSPQPPLARSPSPATP
jgi:hypothetical protein